MAVRAATADLCIASPGGWVIDSRKRRCLRHNCCHTADAGSKVSNFLWTLVAGGALMLLAQSPNMSQAEVMTAVTTAIMVTYSLVAVVLAIIQGERPPARLPACPPAYPGVVEYKGWQYTRPDRQP